MSELRELLDIFEECLYELEDIRASGDAGNWDWDPTSNYVRGMAALEKMRAELSGDE
jgi:hypothetical protein